MGLMDIDFEKVYQLAEQGYIQQQTHPTLPLRILNYTHKTQFDKHWTPETRQCRGLILGPKDEIIARPFPKFFNLGEVEGVPDGPFRVFEKLDGSLGILWQYEGQVGIATRGSFTSPQAIEANKILHEKYSHVLRMIQPRFTYLMEIIYPENRIVIDYKGARDLYLIAVIETQTGRETALLDNEGLALPIVDQYAPVEKLETLTSKPRDNAEGYVLYWPKCQTRLKVKYDEYVRLHRLVTRMSNKVIWEMMRDDQDVFGPLEKVPRELSDWAKETHDKIAAHFNLIERICQEDFLKRPTTTDRGLIAEDFKACKYPSVLFLMLDGKGYHDIIWKIVRPKIDHPFKSQGTALGTTV